MRFIENGPDIPDELLLALDEGRVVFFCGAGVSRARAGLPDFFGLAEQVLTALGVSDKSSAKKLLRVAREVEDQTGLPGLISADRIFGLLEQEFFERDIERTVANVLKPKNGVDLWAHKILLDLATSKEGITKLVTTNFDRLFDDCGRQLETWQPPRLPDLTKPNDLKGVVYLHGRAMEDYAGSEVQGFVLSSAEFGRAYLSEGWATRFFKDVIDKFVVVFVGYTADDPPVRYLLEALNKSSGGLNDVYAFQSDDSEEVSSRWQHKGVSAIPYAGKDGHSALWKTLAAWSERAKDPEAWQKRIIELAQKGPENLSPTQCEQVAHVVSTKEGARKLFESDPPAPATWLCVFDPEIRYENPSEIREGIDEGPFDDPFALFGLAGDPVPVNVKSKQHSAKREMPLRVWNVFTFNRRDRMELRDEHVTPLKDRAALIFGRLPDRVNHLGNWLAKVSDQNAAIWWAARQRGLHPTIQRQIRNNLEQGNSNCASHILQAWHYLFDHWHADKDIDDLDWYRFAHEISVIGWNSKIIRKYESLTRPRMKVSQNYFNYKAVPPKKNDKTDLDRLLMREVVFIENQLEIEVPNEWLADVVAVRRRNLEIAIQLEIECGHYERLNIPPIICSTDPDINEYERTEGVTRAVLEYTNFFERLLKIDPVRARWESATWQRDDDSIFSRLRIWASRFKSLVPNEQFNEFFGEVSREAFWDPYHQRDLLLTLNERWATLPMLATQGIERRILEGPSRRKNEAKHTFVMRNASEIADRLHWLYSKGCALDIDYDSEINRLRSAAPEWKREYAESADRSLETRVRTVHQNTDYSSLLDEPLSNVLIKARELSEHSDDFSIEHDPFSGLCEKHPDIIVAALELEAKRGQFPQWAWRQFLNSGKRKDDNRRLKRFIAELLISACDGALKEIVYPAAEWLLNASENLTVECVPTFERLVERMLKLLRANPEVDGSNILIEGGDLDWVTAALNSPAGKVVQAILEHDPRRKYFKKNRGFPNDWCDLVERMLNLPGDNGRFALIFCTCNLNRFDCVDPEWTKKNILSVLNTDDADTLEAWWAGYLWGYRNPPRFELFQTIKHDLLVKASSQNYDKGGYCVSLAGLVLGNWICSHQENSAERISNDEFRKVLLEAGDRFRSQVLWQLEKRSREDDDQPWRAHQKRFLREVWPIQRVAKTPESSVRLIELAFSSDDNFMAISEAILPLLCPLELDYIVLPSIRPSDESSIVDKHPERVLEILDIVLLENANRWPYEIDATLERLVVAEPTLRSDARWVELMRRWNSR